MACPTNSPCPASILPGTVNSRSQKPTIPKNGKQPKCPKMEVGGGGQVIRFIHFLSKYLLSACYVLGILLGSRFSGNFFFFEFVSVFQIFSHDPVLLFPSNESLYHEKMNVPSIRTMSTTGTDVLRAVWLHAPATTAASRITPDTVAQNPRPLLLCLMVLGVRGLQLDVSSLGPLMFMRLQSDGGWCRSSLKSSSFTCLVFDAGCQQ